MGEIRHAARVRHDLIDLWLLIHESNPADADRLLQMLSVWPDEDLDPVDAILARMENSGRTRKDFEKLVGPSDRASEILNLRRHLTLPMIWRLVQEWKMPAETLVRPYELSVQRTLAGRAARRVRAAS